MKLNGKSRFSRLWFLTAKRKCCVTPVDENLWVDELGQNYTDELEQARTLEG